MTFQEHLAQFREEIEGDFVIPVEASRFLELMRKEHPGELFSWMEDNALRFVSEALRKAELRHRSIAIRRASSRAFASAAEKFAEGDSDDLSLFRTAFVIDEDNTRRHLADMRGKDCFFVASGYEDSG